MMILGMFIVLIAIAKGATIYVPDDYPAIQGANDASVNSDTIIEVLDSELC